MRSYEELNGLAEIVQHPAYAPPPPSETECFRRGTLRFVGVERLVWEGH
jgi:hypothetical protein